MNKTNLKDWLITYIKNKDLFYKKISLIKEEESRIITEMKDNTTTYYFISPDLNTFDTNKLSETKDSRTIIVVLNTKSNVDALVKMWSQIINYKLLSIMFVNPNSNIENKWFVNPYHHHQVSEGNLKNSLMSIFITTTPFNE